MIDIEYTFPNTDNDIFFRNFWESNPVRFVVLENEVWIDADKIAKILEINKNKIKKHIRSLPTEWKKRVLNENGTDRTQLISDAGFAALTITSHNQRAQRLNHWVLQDVLPKLQTEYKSAVVPVQKVQKEESKPDIQEKPKPVPKVEIEDDEPLNLFFDDEEW